MYNLKYMIEKRAQEKQVWDENNFTKQDLEEALRTITSLIIKCEKSQEKITHRTSQRTLLKNRLKALYIASSLITQKLDKI